MQIGHHRAAPKMPSYQPSSPTYNNNRNDNRNDNKNYNTNDNRNYNDNKNLNNNNNYNRNEQNQAQAQSQAQSQNQSLYNNINIENKNVTYVKNHFTPPKPKFHYTPRPVTPPPVTPPPPQIIYMPQPYPVYPPQPTYPTYPTQPPTYPPVQPPVDYGYPPPVDYGSQQLWECIPCFEDTGYWSQPSYPAWEPEAPQWSDYAPTTWEMPVVNTNNNNNAGMIWAEDTASTAATGFQVDPEYEDQAMHDMLITKYGHSPDDVEAFYNEFYPVHSDRLGDAYFGIERECQLRFGRSSKDAKKFQAYTRIAQELRKEYGIGINSYRDF